MLSRSIRAAEVLAAALAEGPEAELAADAAAPEEQAAQEEREPVAVAAPVAEAQAVPVEHAAVRVPPEGRAVAAARPEIAAAILPTTTTTPTIR